MLRIMIPGCNLVSADRQRQCLLPVHQVKEHIAGGYILQRLLIGGIESHTVKGRNAVHPVM